MYTDLACSKQGPIERLELNTLPREWLTLLQQLQSSTLGRSTS